MYAGSLTLCLRASDLEASKRFYEALGLETFDEVPGVRVVLRRGNVCVALMPFLEENWLNFRGADVFAVHGALRAQGLDLPGRPERYTGARHGADADGACWSTRDPAGNVVFFDTNRNEEGPDYARRRLAQLLRNTEQELVDAGASAECLEAFRTHVLAKYTPAD
jgi:catechol 2,3-dioxygenase-like lactoylglutathione lyase family enzyme